MVFIYPAVIHQEDGYWAEFPDLEGAYSQGDTVSEIAYNLEESLAGYLESLLDRELDIPKASELNKITVGNNNFLMLVKADVDINKLKKSVKKTLTIPLWMDEKAKEKNINFSKTLQEAILQKITI